MFNMCYDIFVRQTTTNTNGGQNMKIGLRIPSVKKSFKARTTGRLKRSIKKSINPFYGMKGIGFIFSTTRAINNKIYKKLTISCWDLFKKLVNAQ